VTCRQSRQAKLRGSNLPQSAFVAHWSTEAMAAVKVSLAILWRSLQACTAPASEGPVGPSSRGQPATTAAVAMTTLAITVTLGLIPQQS
jgi:hypothetical protein